MIQTASIELRFDGDIVKDNRVTLRTLGNASFALQKAINRSYLDVKFEGVMKGARLQRADYPETEFYIGGIREGSFIIDFRVASEWPVRIVDRLNAALTPMYSRIQEKAVREVVSIRDRAQTLGQQLDAGQYLPTDYEQISDDDKRNFLMRYGDKSILKEVDQMLTVVRPEHAGDSFLAISLAGSTVSNFPFDKVKSRAFRQEVVRRDLGRLIKYNGRITALDAINLNANFDNYSAKQKCTLHFRNQEDALLFDGLIMKDVSIIASPIMEYGGFDYVAGDIYFIKKL